MSTRSIKKNQPEFTEHDQKQFDQLEFVLSSRTAPTLVFISCESDRIRKKVYDQIKLKFPDYKYKDIDAGPDQIESLFDYLRTKGPKAASTNGAPATIVNIYNVENSLYDLKDGKLEFSPLLSNMNFQRELLFRGLPFTTIIWTDRHFLKVVGGNAKDLWDWVGYVFEFIGKGPDDARQILRDKKVTAIPGKISKRKARIKELKSKLDQISADSNVRTLRERMTIYELLGEEYLEQHSFKDSIIAFKKLLNLSKRINNKHDQAHALFLLGTAYLDSRNLKKAMEIFKGCLVAEQEIGSINLGNVYHQIARVYEELRQWNLAIENYDLAIEWNTKMQQLWHLGSSYQNIGSIYVHQDKWNKALENYEQAIMWKIKTNQKHELGYIYHQIGILYEYQHKWNLAIENYNQSINLNSIYQPFALGNTYHHIGRVWESQAQWDLAIKNYNVAIEYNIKNGQEYFLGATYHHIGRVYEERGKWSSAIKYYKLSIDVKNKYDQKHLLPSSYYHIGRVYEQQGKNPKALKNFLKSKEFSEKSFMEHQLPLLEESIQRVSEKLKSNSNKSES